MSFKSKKFFQILFLSVSFILILNFASAEAIIADHNAVDDFENIPDYWIEQAKQLLVTIDGVMIGREAYHNPYLLAEVDNQFYAVNEKIRSRMEILQDFIPYVEQQLALGVPLQAMTRHILGLFQGLPGARAWRRYLSENVHKAGAGSEVIKLASKFILDSVLGSGDNI